MNNEIKEILYNIYKIVKFGYNPEIVKQFGYKEFYILKEYIINLHEQIEMLVKDDEKSQKTIIRLASENITLENKIERVISTVNYYATEDEDSSKIYNLEEAEILDILGSD